MLSVIQASMDTGQALDQGLIKKSVLTVVVQSTGCWDWGRLDRGPGLSTESHQSASRCLAVCSQCRSL